MSQYPHDHTAPAGMTDLLLDALSDLTDLLCTWSPTAWLLLAQATRTPAPGLEQTRAVTRMRAAMLGRTALHTHGHTRLAAFIPDQPDLTRFRAALDQALSDAYLAMIMCDVIGPEDNEALLHAVRTSIPTGLGPTQRSDTSA